jgi:hypothetical protein
MSKNQKTKHKFINENFNLSTDYRLLYKLALNNVRIPAWIVYTDEYEEPIWDLVEVKKFYGQDDKIFIGTRGRDYSTAENTIEWFESICQHLCLHFVVPKQT